MMDDIVDKIVSCAVGDSIEHGPYVLTRIAVVGCGFEEYSRIYKELSGRGIVEDHSLVVSFPGVCGDVSVKPFVSSSNNTNGLYTLLGKRHKLRV